MLLYTRALLVCFNALHIPVTYSSSYQMKIVEQPLDRGIYSVTATRLWNIVEQPLDCVIYSVTYNRN